jgi:hypothetical protein
MGYTGGDPLAPQGQNAAPAAAPRVENWAGLFMNTGGPNQYNPEALAALASENGTDTATLQRFLRTGTLPNGTPRRGL